MFWLKKFVVFLLSPLGIFLVLLAGGLFLAWRQRFGPWPRRLVIAAVVGLYAVSCGPTGELLLSPLEDRHPSLVDPSPADDATHVVVLGGGYRHHTERPATSNLVPSSMIRLAEGIRVHQALDDASLVVSGAAVTQPRSTAEAMADLARELGVSEDDIVVSDTPRDTAEEAAAVDRLVGDDHHVVLVTSASHMPRAMTLFERQGITVTAAPTHHLTGGAVFAADELMPRAQNLHRVERALYEYTALLWVALGGS